MIVLSNLLPYSYICEEISCVVGGRDWRVSLQTEVDRCFILLEHTYMLAKEALWDDQNHMLTYVH